MPLKTKPPNPDIGLDTLLEPITTAMASQPREIKYSKQVCVEKSEASPCLGPVSLSRSQSVRAEAIAAARGSFRNP
ncbi:hypothetical protein ERO13_A01G064850v2 [Gossypium hirsutum]|nr:hypothetical protein ERO13_A01G064850v2 [Gossypium hirsutum]